MGMAFATATVSGLMLPDTCYQTQGLVDDGTLVKVRRPIIGFRSCEQVVGLTGGHEVSYDGWRYNVLCW